MVNGEWWKIIKIDWGILTKSYKKLLTKVKKWFIKKNTLYAWRDAMTDLEKIRFKNKIAEELGKRSSNAIHLFIKDFKVRYPKNMTYSDTTSYALGRLKHATRKQIIEMVERLNIADPNEKKYDLRTPTAASKNNKNFVRAFISHSTKNKAYAMEFKIILKQYGIIAFVSDEDIKGGQLWQKRIRKEIDEMHVFIPIHTKQFSKSLWCQQESGLAFARKTEVEIIPIDFNMRKRPESFLTNFQYIDKKTKTTEVMVKEILDTLKDSEKTKVLYTKIISPKIKKLAKLAKLAKDSKKMKQDRLWQILKSIFIPFYKIH